MAAGAPMVATRVGGTPEAIAGRRHRPARAARRFEGAREAIARLLETGARRRARPRGAAGCGAELLPLSNGCGNRQRCTGTCWRRRERPSHRPSLSPVDATRSLSYPASSCSVCRSAASAPRSVDRDWTIGRVHRSVCDSDRLVADPRSSRVRNLQAVVPHSTPRCSAWRSSVWPRASITSFQGILVVRMSRPSTSHIQPPTANFRPRQRSGRS